MTMTATRAPEATAAARPRTRRATRPGSQPVAQPVAQPADRQAPGDLEPPAKQRRAVARALGLSDLMSRRPDLHGVYPPADVAAEAVRWSA
jgi:hypothetical protein